jgi:hypothetical protein
VIFLTISLLTKINTMKNRLAFIALFGLLPLLYNAGNCFSTSGTGTLPADCFSGDCLLCYLSLPAADDRFIRLKEHFSLESPFGTVYSHRSNGLVIFINDGRISQVRFENPVAFPDMPLRITPVTTKEELEARFGPSVAELPYVYRFFINKGLQVDVSYREGSALDRPSGVFFKVLPEYYIDPGCFNGSFNASMVKHIFGTALNLALLSAEKGFEGSDTLSFGVYGKGWIYKNRYSVEIGKALSIEGARQKVIEFDAMLGSLTLECCRLDPYPEGAAREESLEKNYLGRLVIPSDEKLHPFLTSVMIYCQIFPEENGTYELYMIIYPPEK